MGNSLAEPGQRMTASESRSQVETDLDRARERLSFYEQFDEIIKQNISSSSALLREASARFDSDVAEERGRYRALLSDILDEVTALQAQSERLARRVNDALDELENRLPGDDVASVAPGIAAEAPPEAAAVIGAATSGTRKRPDRDKPAAAASEPPARPVPAAPVLPTVAPVAELPPTGPASTTLLVHGVPRASAALALKSYIEQLDFVSAVEPREFAAGLLRLQVDGSRSITLGDLAGWTMADRIELKNAGADLLELGLIPA
jgi:hypothetical protein